MDKRTYSDEELVAYLDGEADFAPIAEIDQAAKQDAQLAARIDALRFDTDAIKDGFSGLLNADISVPELPAQPSAWNSFGFGTVAASALLALTIGYGAGNLGNTPPQKGWKAYVASYQALYSPATLQSVEGSAEMLTAELSLASSAIGKNLDIAQLTVPTDVTLKRAQVLNFKGKPLVQLAFLSAAGEPMALCIIKTKKKNGVVSETTVMEGMNTTSWAKDGYEYFLIGGTDKDLISKLADQYSKSI